MFKVNSEKAKSEIMNSAISGKDGQPGNSASHPGTAKSDVRLTGGLQLGDTDNLAFTATELGSVLSQLFEAKKWNSLRSLVRTYPDIVAKILMADERGSLSQDQLVELAKLYDEQWRGDGQDTWLGYVQTTQPGENPSDFAEARARFLKLLENDEPSQALELDLGQTLEGQTSLLANAEALRLEGVANLMLGNDQASRDQLAKAMHLLKDSHPYQASQLALLLGESQRHAGALKEWKSSWKLAIDIQSRWLAQRNLQDPGFWKQAAYLRPASTPWPTSVVGRLENGLRDDNLDFGSDQTTDNEAVVWATVGTQSLKRHEPQNAILALKKSEALVTSPFLKEELQMQQALAMISAGQQGPASAILLRLGSKSSLLGDRSKAILATMKLQNGSLAQGMNLLQSAIKTSNQWPASERLRAQADYGLSYLIRGREEQGIALLNQVHAEFVKQKSFDHAAQCLENIAAYYEETDQPIKHRTAIARLKKLEAF